MDLTLPPLAAPLPQRYRLATGSNMDGPSFRHLVPKPWKPELRYLDLKLNLSAGARLIAANDALFAVPWASAYVESLTH